MASASTLSTSPGQLSKMDSAHQQWKEQNQSAEPKQETGEATSSAPFATCHEAAPDIEVDISVFYVSGQSKFLQGNLNPTRTVEELLARLAPQLDLDPAFVAMSWSKKLNNDNMADPVLLARNRCLMSYDVQTDDTIIIRESRQKINIGSNPADNQPPQINGDVMGV